MSEQTRSEKDIHAEDFFEDPQTWRDVVNTPEMQEIKNRLDENLKKLAEGYQGLPQGRRMIFGDDEEE